MNVVRLKAFEFTLHLPSSHSVLCCDTGTKYTIPCEATGDP